MDQKQRIQLIKLDAIVALKLIRLANDQLDDQQIGYLLGLVQEDIVEVTNSYAIPPETSELKEENDQLMMEYARKNYLDAHKVGLYIISDNLDHFQIDYFEQLRQMTLYIRYAFVLVYSPQLSKQGHPNPFQAFTINDKFNLYTDKNDLLFEDFQAISTKHDKLYKPINVELTKSPLQQFILHKFGKHEVNQARFTSNISYQNRQLTDEIDQAIFLSDRINTDVQTKKQYQQPNTLQINDVIEYLIVTNKINALTEQIRKESTFTIESESIINKLFA